MTKVYQTNEEIDQIMKDEKWREYVEMMCEKDEIDRELNTKWRHANWIKHCKDSWTKDIKNIK
jgi:uncharacterized protein YlbG (UPF0298 family)